MKPRARSKSVQTIFCYRHYFLIKATPLSKLHSFVQNFGSNIKTTSLIAPTAEIHHILPFDASLTWGMSYVTASAYMLTSFHPLKSMLITVPCLINTAFLIFIQNKKTNFNDNSQAIRASVSYVDTSCVMPTGIWLTGWKTYKTNPTKNLNASSPHPIWNFSTYFNKKRYHLIVYQINLQNIWLIQERSLRKRNSKTEDFRNRPSTRRILDLRGLVSSLEQKVQVENTEK